MRSKDLNFWIYLMASEILMVFSQRCSKEKERFADSSQCDKYIECRKGEPVEELCPEGLLFDESLKYPRYPCVYPNEVDCGSRSQTQPAQPTDECPHQFGLYIGGAVSSGCSATYTNCAGGKAYESECPVGLAWSQETVRCEWPDEITGCDPSGFLGYTCPGYRDELGLLLNGHSRHAHQSDRRQFWVCVDGTIPRLLSCAEGEFFNPDINACDDGSVKYQ